MSIPLFPAVVGVVVGAGFVAVGDVGAGFVATGDVGAGFVAPGDVGAGFVAPGDVGSGFNGALPFPGTYLTLPSAAVNLLYPFPPNVIDLS